MWIVFYLLINLLNSLNSNTHLMVNSLCRDIIMFAMEVQWIKAHSLPCKTWQTSLGRSSMSFRSCHRCCSVASPSGLLFFHSTSILSFCMVTSFSAAWMSSSWLELRSRWMATSFHSLPSLLATVSSCFSDASPLPLRWRPAAFTPSGKRKQVLHFS